MLLTSSGEIPDPFLAALRRRHPDVDVVLLPGLSPVPDDPAPELALDADVDASIRRVTHEAHGVAVVLGPPQGPEALLASGTRPGWVRAEATGLVRRTDGVDALHRLARRLGGDGWRTAWPPDGLVRLEARSPDAELTLRAGFAPEHRTLVWSLRGPDLDVGPDRARRLVRADRPAPTGGA